MSSATMQFKLLVPADVCVAEKISQLDFEAIDGHRTFLPHHQDFFTALPAGIVIYHTHDDTEESNSPETYVAIDHGLLVKCAFQVTLTAHHAVSSDSLSDLRALVRERFVDVDEQQKLARTALARLEAGAIRQFMNLEHLHHG